MGFRNGAFAKVWETNPLSDTAVKMRISISRKNKQTEEYEQDFSGFVLACGTSAASKALKLKDGDRIKLGDVDVTTRFDKEKGVTYTNYKVFSFDVDEAASAKPKEPAVDDGDPEAASGDLPY